jgi:hypothetical protein
MKNTKLTELQNEIAVQEKLIKKLKAESDAIAAANKEGITDHTKQSVLKFIDYIVDNKIIKYVNSREEFVSSEAYSAEWNEWKLVVEKVYGGGEGDGEEHWAILRLTDPFGEESFWKIPGYYQSYDGGNLEVDDIFRVTPHKVEVTQYKNF